MLIRASYRRRQQGLSLVDLMVGITIGMFIITGALALFSVNLAQSRRLLAQTRVEEDLRAIADLMTRDIRRAAYWGNSVQGTVAIGATSNTTPNPYVAITVTPSTSNGVLQYEFSRDSVENNALGSNEQFGYQLDSNTGALQMQTSSGSWQNLNDTNLVKITSLSITDSSPPVLSLGYRCPVVCLAGTPNCPQMFVRRYDIVLTGQSTLDTSVVRTMRTSVRARNDQITGSC